MDTNRVIITGRLGRDVECRYTPKGTAVADLSVAVGRTWKDEAGEKHEEVCWLSCTVWGAQAENCAQYLTKGSPVLVEGHLTEDKWDDKETGQKRSKIKVVAQRVQFLSGKSADGIAQAGPTEEQEVAQAPPKRHGKGAPAAEPVKEPGDGESDNIPFRHRARRSDRRHLHHRQPRRFTI